MFAMFLYLSIGLDSAPRVFEGETATGEVTKEAGELQTSIKPFRRDKDVINFLNPCVGRDRMREREGSF